MATKKRNAGGEGQGKAKKPAGEATTADAGNGAPRAEADAVEPTPALATTTLSHAIQQVRPMARDAFEESRGQSQQMVQDFEGAIREQPIRSLLMAAGVGFVIGLIWK